MSKRALLVGLNTYDQLPELQCCVDDATAMAAVLGRHADGSPNYDCRLLTTDRARVTERELRANIRQLLSDFQGGDALFYFSGHGLITDTGGWLATQDAQPDDAGFPMSELLQLANQSGVGSILLILDCCHSGSIGDAGGGELRAEVTMREGVTILAASTADQEAQEGLEHSLFTELVLDALDGGAADIRGGVSAASLYAYVEQALGSWQQRPMYKSHARRLDPIRRCEPAVPDEVLRRLPSLFTSPSASVAMDPSYERTSPRSDPQNVAKFDTFKLLRDARLLRTTDGRDLYYAALESGDVMLTPLGRFYWQQAANNRI